MIDQWIARLDTWYRQNRPAFYDTLLPGLTPAELDDLQTQLGLTLPDDFRALYSWRSGQSSQECFTIEHRCWLMSVDRIVDISRQNQELAEEFWRDGMEPHILDVTDFWNSKWIPFLHTWYSVDYVCLDTGGSYGGEIGQLIDVPWKEDYRVVDHSGIEGWLRTLVSMLEEGGKSWGEWMDEDDDLDFYRNQHDPGYPKMFPASKIAQCSEYRLRTMYE